MGREPAVPAPHGVGGSEPAADDPVEVLRRWVAFGGTWRILSQTPHSVTISLCRCDGGEEQQRLTTTDPAVVSWLADPTG